MEKFFTGPNLMFLGLMIWSGLMLRNAAVRSRRSGNRNVPREWQTELRAKQRSSESQIQQLEVRLHDYDRDVAARMDTTMRMLDQWIVEADREIVQLETLLEERRAERSSPLPPEQRRMVVHLAGAGYSISEMARLIDRPAEVVAEVLSEDENSDRRAA